MFLYSSDALSRVVGGATADQMETKIANELPKATEAAVNSEIDLQFNLVHAGPVSEAGVGNHSSIYVVMAFASGVGRAFSTTTPVSAALKGSAQGLDGAIPLTTFSALISILDHVRHTRGSDLGTRFVCSGRVAVRTTVDSQCKLPRPDHWLSLTAKLFTPSSLLQYMPLPHCPQLPYEQAGVGEQFTGSELDKLRQRADVKALRDLYVADLVVLVGSFAGTCGLG